MRKNIICTLTVLLYLLASHAQVKHIYIRVFNIAGERIAKGKLIATTDSSLLIEKDKVQHEIAVSSIGVIKIKRSLGHAVAVGAVIGGVSGGIIGLASAGQDKGSSFEILDYSPAEGFAGGLIAGGATGAAIGALCGLLQKRQTIVINGNLAAWQKERQSLPSL
ncbi:hypothetical protein [Foetidibacter luteolus]|uniref:hypothetical protein n=1 Tax=Foetidibacter luteolus TaxID=2608880 RepID=UPI00129B5CD6|nr:hypothetical protein [Foetidibacter luteolus]